MNIYLYQNTKPISHMARTLTNPLQITGEPKEADSLDVVNPDIVLEYNSAYLQYNFCFIPDYGRYYYFREAPTITKKTITLHLCVDVKYTYRNIIMRSQCIAERSSSWFDLFLNDGAVEGVTGYEYFEQSLPYKFRPDSGTYILTVGSGG